MDKQGGDYNSLPSRRGNAVHETLEELTKAWTRNVDLPWGEVEKILTEKITKFQVGQDDIKTCIGAAQKYMKNPPGGIEHIVGTEEALALSWDEEKNDFAECDWNDPYAIVRGKIDILMMEGKVAKIIDHKTQLYVCKADTFQMGFYAWLVKKFYPYVEEVETVLHFCHPDLDRYSNPTTWTLDDIDLHESEIKIRINRAENLTEFSAQPNDGCVYCPMNMNCPKIDDAPKLRTKFNKVKNAPIITAQEAQEVAGVLLVLDENKKILQNRLQSFVKEIGPVVIPGKEFSYKKKDGWEVNPRKKEDLFNFLKDSGVNPFDYFDVSMPKLKGIWKNHKPAFIEKVKKFLVSTVSSTWGSRKV